MTEKVTTPRQAGYALGLLFLVALFNYIDRSIVAVLQVPIKRDLDLSDTEIGALTGLSFALFYTTLALPIARLADRVTRKRLMAAVFGLWSAMTALSGLATSFGLLVLLRMGVAMGEAGCAPTTHSLIADYFPLGRRATAISIWGVSLPVGTMLGFYLGGTLGEAVGWRGTFLILGIIGVVLAPFVLMLREPIRGQFEPAGRATPTPPPLRQAIAILWSFKSFRYLMLAQALHAYVYLSVVNWNAPFYVRVHGMPIAQAGLYLGLLSGLGGGLGVFLGGVIADRLGVVDRRWYCWLPAIASLLLLPLAMLQYFAADSMRSLLFAILPSILFQIYLAPGVAMAQSLVPPGMRAFTSAVMVMTVNILGMGLGPVTTGAISDFLSADFGLGTDALRIALAGSLIFCLPAAVLFVRAAHYLPAELDGRATRQKARQDSPSFLRRLPETP